MAAAAAVIGRRLELQTIGDGADNRQRRRQQRQRQTKQWSTAADSADAAADVVLVVRRTADMADTRRRWCVGAVQADSFVCVASSEHAATEHAANAESSLTAARTSVAMAAAAAAAVFQSRWTAALTIGGDGSGGCGCCDRAAA